MISYNTGKNYEWCSIIEIPYGFKGKVFQSPMPFSPYDPITRVWSSYLAERIDIVVVLAENQEILLNSNRDLIDFYKSYGLTVIHYPIQDFHTPVDIQSFDNLIAKIITQASYGKNLVCHCLAGVGRTGLILAAIARKSLGLGGDEAILWLRGIIPGALENTEQEQFIREYNGE